VNYISLREVKRTLSTAYRGVQRKAPPIRHLPNKHSKQYAQIYTSVDLFIRRIQIPDFLPQLKRSSKAVLKTCHADLIWR